MTVEFVNGYPTEAVTPRRGKVYPHSAPETVVTPVEVRWVGQPPMFDDPQFAEIGAKIGYAIAHLHDYFEEQEPGFMGVDSDEKTVIDVTGEPDGTWTVTVTYPCGALPGDIVSDGQGGWYPEV